MKSEKRLEHGVEDALSVALRQVCV